MRNDGIQAHFFLSSELSRSLSLSTPFPSHLALSVIDKHIELLIDTFVMDKTISRIIVE